MSNRRIDAGPDWGEIVKGLLLEVIAILVGVLIAKALGWL